MPFPLSALLPWWLNSNTLALFSRSSIISFYSLDKFWPKWPVSCSPDFAGAFSSLWLFSVPFKAQLRYCSFLKTFPYLFSFIPSSNYWTFNLRDFLGHLSQNRSSCKVEIIMTSLKNIVSLISPAKL